MLSPEDFVVSKGKGCVLTPESFERYLQRYEEWMGHVPGGRESTWRELLRHQAEAVKRFIVERGASHPF
jgi:hypothetical protein